MQDPSHSTRRATASPERVFTSSLRPQPRLLLNSNVLSHVQTLTFEVVKASAKTLVVNSNQGRSDVVISMVKPKKVVKKVSLQKKIENKMKKVFKR